MIRFPLELHMVHSSTPETSPEGEELEAVVGVLFAGTTAADPVTFLVGFLFFVLKEKHQRINPHAEAFLNEFAFTGASANANKVISFQSLKNVRKKF